MVDKKRIIVGIILVGMAVVGAFYFFQSEEQKVMRRINLLADKISKESTEPAIIMAQRMKSLGDIFAETCVIESDRHDLSRQYTPETIRSYAASARAQFQSLSLEFFDIKIKFPSDDVAIASMTGILSGISKSEEIFDETHEMEMELVKVENEWFIRRIRAVEVLKK